MSDIFGGGALFNLPQGARRKVWWNEERKELSVKIQENHYAERGRKITG